MEKVNVWELNMHGTSFISPTPEGLCGELDMMTLDDVMTIRKKEMTLDEFNNLPDFEGW